MFIYDPCDDVPDGDWFKRGQLTKLLAALPPICDPHNAFKTVLNPEDREQLQLIVKGIKERSLEHMKKDEFTAVRDSLNHIQSITQIGSAFVNNLLDEAKEGLRRYLETLENDAWNHMDDKNWRAANDVVQRLARAARELHPRPLAGTAKSMHSKAERRLQERKRQEEEMEQMRENAARSQQALDALNATVQSLREKAKSDQENMKRIEVILRKSRSVKRHTTLNT